MRTIRPHDFARVDQDQRNEDPGAGEQAGEAVGGIGGTLAGAALGTAAGPVGMILGGLAGAFGGWWAGEKAGRAAEDLESHDPYYRAHFEKQRQPALRYDEARVGYGLGHIAGRNPDYAGRTFEQIEGDLRRGWNYEKRDFETMRPYLRTGYERTVGGK
jgi:hypothetical protein